jgi:peptide/nickel transport system substrate-binding protein
MVGVAALVCVVLAGGLVGAAAAQPKPEGEMRWALYVTLSPVWFDPGEVVGQLTPFWILYAIHDALVKPMPGNLMTPSLAESWTLSPDQRVYEFKLREGLRFHNGDPFTAEDVKFSFQRAKGARILKEKVREVEAVGPSRVRFHLHEPWPDFMAFYGTLATGAGWIAPRKYVDQVGNEGFKKHYVRPGAARAHLRVHLAERDRAPGGRARTDADQPLSVVGAAGGGTPQEVRRAGLPQGGAHGVRRGDVPDRLRDPSR